MIEATKGDSEAGYVAVDTVMLQDQFSQCATRPAEADPGANTTPAPAVLTNCDFEAGLCGWVMYRVDQKKVCSQKTKIGHGGGFLKKKIHDQ